MTRRSGGAAAPTTDLDRCARWALALLSLGAGGIHFAAAAQHVEQAWYHATFFGVVAWLQLAGGIALVMWHSRQLLVATAVVNAAVVGVWVVSRTAGLPFGDEAGVAEPVAFLDGLASAFEALLVVGSVLLLSPALATRRVPTGSGLAGLSGLGGTVVALSLLSLTPTLAGDHAEGNGHAGGHGRGSVTIAADGTSACERSGHPGAAGRHGHHGPEEYETPGRTERARLMNQVAEADAAAVRYPTVRTALTAGYEKVTEYLPCVAAHYFKRAALRNPFDPAEPEVLLFDGTEPDSRIVGVSYLQLGDPATEPDGFAGTNDHWHVHPSFCVRNGVILDPAIPIGSEECAATGGSFQPAGNLWMLHMWNVPGWDSRWGLFSSEHPDLGTDGAAGLQS